MTIQTLSPLGGSRTSEARMESRSSPPGVEGSIHGKTGRLVVWREESLSPLSMRACETITQTMLKWKNNRNIELITIEHAAPARRVCAREASNPESLPDTRLGRDGCDLIESEYRLADLIANFPKPCVAIMDGVTIGGGVGPSIHGTYRIATENTVFSMPETGIGFFPDKGATWVLPRLPGQIGTWLALTGARLKGEEVLAAGLATHYCLSNEIEGLKQRFAREGLGALRDYQSIARPMSLQKKSEIDVLFEGDDTSVILTRLESGNAWAKSQATKMRAKSPLSVKIAMRQLQTGPYLTSLRQALQIEYRIAHRLIESRNFREGVRAVLVDKDHAPRWRPSSLRTVSYDVVSQYFTPLGKRELQFAEIIK